MGLVSVLPPGWVDWPRWTALARWALLHSIREVVIELVSGYLVGGEADGLPREWNGQLLSSCRSDRLVAVLFVGAVALLLLLYASGQLLLGLMLALGMAAG